MTNKTTSKSRGKKALETPLGKAPSFTTGETIDLSHIRKPIETSIFGLFQVLRLFETATDEVRRYVAYECDLIYECRICRTIFRSLANFILHKRSYCTDSYRSDTSSCNTFQQPGFTFLKEDTTIFDCDNSRVNSPVDLDSNAESSNECPANNTRNETKRKKDLGLVLNRLYDKQESSVITEQCVSEELSNESLTSEKESVKNNIALEKLNNSNAGVYQTLFPHFGKNCKVDFMKTEVMEIHDILENNEAILGIDGKILVSESEKNSILKNNYVCSVCNLKFSTKKTLTYHIRYKHNNSRLVYPCTDCKETFANAWCVFRHLYKVHQKSTAQVRKLRELIHNSATKRSDAGKRKTRSSSSEIPEKAHSRDQQWIDNFEGDNDLQRCGGCGRKFERKAALHSHSQFCAKRIAVCNSLKENSKKVQIDEKCDKVVKPSTNDVVIVEPTRRRKPLIAQKVHRFDEFKETDMLEEVIAPFPHQNDSSVINEKQISDEDNSKLYHVGHDDSQDNKTLTSINTFYVGAVAVSKVQKVATVETESSLQITNDTENELNKNYRNEEISAKDSETEVSVTEVIPTDDPYQNNEHEQDTKQDSETLAMETEDSNIKVDCSEEYEKSISDTLEPKSEYTTISINKSQISLTKKSLKYVSVETQTCLPCKKRFNNHKSLMKHMALHFSWYRYHCCICKYLSYTKSKCRRHVITKHLIRDKLRLRNVVKRISRSQTHETATNFIKHYKQKRQCITEANEELVVSEPTKTDSCNNTSTHDNIQDPLVRQMVMEVIFGTSQAVVEEVLPLNCSDKCTDTSSVNDTNGESNVPPIVQNNELLIVEPPQKCARPIRRRIKPTHKDFLYDKPAMKLKRARDRKLKPKVKLRSTVLKQFSASLNINTNEDSINCTQLVKPDSSLVKHVTADVI